MLQAHSVHTMPVTTHFLYKNGLEFLLCESQEEKATLQRKKELSPKVPEKSSATKFVPPVAPKPMYSSPRSSEEAREKAEILNPSSPYPAPIIMDYQWPSSWEELWKRAIRIEKPGVVWTYPGLHSDLTSKENNPRKALVRQLRGSLGSISTHAFWPFDMPETEGMVMTENEAHLFWSGIHRLKPRMLFVFGSQSRDALLLPKKGNYTSFNYGGIIVHIFPDPNRVIEKLDDINTLQVFMKKKMELSFG